ncbi:MAG: hypothetical protein R2824_22505 [Saprospiraceae bacterium]|nr:hypothetical protein [Lewinella sp.]
MELQQLIDSELLNVVGLKSDQAECLYHAIQTGEVKDHEDGIALFYPESRRGVDQFTELRKKLQPRLVNSVLSADELHQGYWKRFYQVSKQLIAATILWNRGKAVAAAQLAEDVSKTAAKYHFTRLAAEANRRLTYHYSVMVPDERRYRSYKEKMIRQEELLYWEQKAYSFYHEIGLFLRTAKTVSNTLMETAQGFSSELDQADTNIQTLDFMRMRYSVAVMYHLMQNDASGVIEACREVLSYFRGLPFKAPVRSARSFQINSLPAYLKSGRYKEAEITLEELKQTVHSGSTNWISIFQYQAILGFHTGRLELVHSALSALRQSRLHHRIEEETQIYQLYLDFLEGKKDYQLGRFMNEVPHYTADKKGMNINVLILQYLISIQRGDRPAIIDRMEALQAYAYRHLKGDPMCRRSELFFRLLYLLARSAFEVPEVERRSPGLFLQLRETSRQIAAIDIEVVPYEELWERVKSLV